MLRFLMSWITSKLDEYGRPKKAHLSPEIQKAFEDLRIANDKLADAVGKVHWINKNVVTSFDGDGRPLNIHGELIPSAPGKRMFMSSKLLDSLSRARKEIGVTDHPNFSKFFSRPSKVTPGTRPSPPADGGY